MCCADPSRIDIHDAREVRYWAKEFGVTEERLRAAVRKVGPKILDVEGALTFPE